MPVSRRNKVVALTHVTKKGRTNKDKLIDDIRTSCDAYKHVYLFQVRNMRNNKFKEIRLDWEGSRFFLGKNKVMGHALGLNEEDAHKPGLNLISVDLKGNNIGIFFTNKSEDEVIEYFNDYEVSNFARSGFKCTHDFALKKGILEDQPFSMEPQLRKLGLNTRLNNGKVELENDTIICKDGDILTPNQCKLLELFGIEMALMRVILLSHLDMEAGQFDKYEVAEYDEGDDGEEAMDDE